MSIAEQTIGMDSADFGVGTTESVDFAKKMQENTVAVRVRISKLGTRRALSKAQISKAAAVFEADEDKLRATKKIVDTKDPAFRRPVNILSQAKAYHKAMTTPFGESAVGLMSKKKVEEFSTRMEEFASELEVATGELQEVWSAKLEEARVDLGELFDPSDYPLDIRSSFSIRWDYPNVTQAPDYLKDLHPDLYKQAQAAIAKKFEDAVSLAERAFTEELASLVDHMADRLKPGEDGKKKLFFASSIDNLKAFFSRFKELSVGSNQDLDVLVSQAEQLMDGVTPDAVRKNVTVRDALSAGMDEIKQSLDTMITSKVRAIDLSDEDDE